MLQTLIYIYIQTHNIKNAEIELCVLPNFRSEMIFFPVAIFCGFRALCGILPFIMRKRGGKKPCTTHWLIRNSVVQVCRLATFSLIFWAVSSFSTCPAVGRTYSTSLAPSPWCGSCCGACWFTTTRTLIRSYRTKSGTTYSVPSDA